MTWYVWICIKETKRILKVGTNVGFLAKTATRVLGMSNKNIPVELDLLGNLKGPIMKVAQILSTIPDAF